MTLPDPLGDKDQDENSATVQALGADASHLRALQRHIAEALLKQGTAAIDGAADAFSPEEARRLLHELRVHQIELEMQNQTLRESQVALDAMRERYFDLYDLAPIAYCTINGQGLIWQANLATASLFGLTRNVLLNQPFSRRIFFEDQDTYYLGRQRLAAGLGPQALELRLLRGDGNPFWAGLTIEAGQDPVGNPEVRIVLADISEQREMDAGYAQIRQALREKNTELENIRDAADEAARVRSGHIIEMHREIELGLRTALAKLQNASSPALTQEQRQNMEKIERAGKHLSSLLADYADPATTGTGH